MYCLWNLLRRYQRNLILGGLSFIIYHSCMQLFAFPPFTGTGNSSPKFCKNQFWRWTSIQLLIPSISFPLPFLFLSNIPNIFFKCFFLGGWTFRTAKCLNLNIYKCCCCQTKSKSLRITPKDTLELVFETVQFSNSLHRLTDVDKVN